MNHYLSVFTESLWTSSVVPLGHEPTFYAMLDFGGYNMPLAAAIAVLGSTTGLMFNWSVGKAMLALHVKKSLHVSDEWYDWIAMLFNKYGVFLLLLSWVPLFKLLVVVAGFLNAKPKFVLPLIVVGQVFNYGRYLL